MSQIWNLPMASSATLSSSRGVLNDGMDALRTHFIGNADPTTLTDGMIWVNTTEGTTGKIKARRGGVTVVLGDWGTNMGTLRKDGTVELTGTWSAGNNRITNIGAPATGSADAARMLDVEGRLSLSGGAPSRTMAGGAQIFYTTPGTLAANSLAHKEYVDTKIDITGSSVIAGRMGYSSGASLTASTVGDRSLLSRAEIEALTTFSPSVGHRHDNTDGRRVLASSLSTSDIAAGLLMISGAGGLPSFVADRRAIQGVYTGDGSTNRVITTDTLGGTPFNFTPVMVMVFNISPFPTFRIGCGGWAVAFTESTDLAGLQTPYMAYAISPSNTLFPVIATGGFTVSNGVQGAVNTLGGMNRSGITYRFIVFPAT